MSYIALYRKYRSQTFDELMGQEQVTVTLQNAIRSGRIAHAYLFYGARGCGKTSTARLLARALNCVAQDGPTPQPCGKCRLCLAIRDGICMDVIEMDAASETGIDDVREKIVENVQYAPGEARYKVYIIDEVHDLSAKAFDALLKTLEEPPPHVIFILATTEQHKVPITIRSRCMPYHFKRGTLQDLVTAVQRVIDAEGCTAEPEAVQAIARAAEGSWRDALSVLEQVLAYADGHVTADLVHSAIGSVGTEMLARVTETLARGDWSETLAVAGELIDSGKDVRQLLTTLSAHLRDLMLISAGARNSAQRELGPERYALLQMQAVLFDPATLLSMSSVLAMAEREIRFTNQHRWLLESTLLRLMPANLASLSTPARGTSPVPAAAQPLRETIASTPTVVPRPRVLSASDDSPGADEDSTPEPPIVRVAPPVAPLSPESARPSTPKAAPDASPARGESLSPAATPTDSRFAADISLEVIARAWPRVLTQFKKVSPSFAPWLEKGEVAALEGHTIVLSFADSFARERIQDRPKGKAKIEEVINHALNTDGYKIRCITRDPASIPVPEMPARVGGPADPGMALLLDAPDAAGTPAAPLRIADFEAANTALGEECSTTPEIAGAAKDSRLIVGDVIVSVPLPTSNGKPAEPADGSLLAEALSVFGGSVVRTEPRTP